MWKLLVFINETVYDTKPLPFLPFNRTAIQRTPAWCNIATKLLSVQFWYMQSRLGPPQMKLYFDIEMVQRRAASPIFNDFGTTKSACDFVARLEHPEIESRRKVDLVCMIYKVIKGRVDTTLPSEVHQTHRYTTRAHNHMSHSVTVRFLECETNLIKHN